MTRHTLSLLLSVTIIWHKHLKLYLRMVLTLKRVYSVLNYIWCFFLDSSLCSSMSDHLHQDYDLLNSYYCRYLIDFHECKFSCHYSYYYFYLCFIFILLFKLVLRRLRSWTLGIPALHSNFRTSLYRAFFWINSTATP